MHPDNIGPYKVLRKIGAGGMGNVYLAKHTETGKEVAVKVLPASMAREDGFVSRFSREIEAMRALDHPHIVKLFENGETDDGSYYFSMEYVDGETLTSVVTRRRRIPWREVIEVALEIASALKAAHDAGIVHRDLKPSNLMIGSDGHIKLTDFGVAHVFATTRLTRTGGVVGTAEYMSPEQARGKQATRHSDLYSLGAVMYVMLTGRPPFTGKSAADIMHQHQFSQFDKPSHYIDLPRLLENYVCQLLEKKPDDRFPDAYVAIRTLQNAKSRIEYDLARTETSAGQGVDSTMAAVDDQTRAGTLPQRDRGQPGYATMVRDAVKGELKGYKSPIAMLLDNTIVLLLLFGGLIWLSVYLIGRNRTSPAEQLAEAKALMEKPASNAWLMARDTLIALRDDESPDEDREQIDAWIEQADQYEFCRRLNGDTSADETAMTEIQRQLRLAFDRHAAGDVTSARQQLVALQRIAQTQPNTVYLRQFIAATLQSWSQERLKSGRQALLDEIVHAAKVAADQGDATSESELLDAARNLYNNDPLIEDQLQSTQQKLSAEEGSSKP